MSELFFFCPVKPFQSSQILWKDPLVALRITTPRMIVNRVFSSNSWKMAAKLVISKWKIAYDCYILSATTWALGSMVFWWINHSFLENGRHQSMSCWTIMWNLFLPAQKWNNNFKHWITYTSWEWSSSQFLIQWDVHTSNLCSSNL